MVKSIWLEIFRLWSGAFLLAEGDKVTRHSSLFIFSACCIFYFLRALLLIIGVLFRDYDK